MPEALVFGGSGQIGMPLLARLQAHGWDAIAVSRTPQVDGPGLRWLRGDLGCVDGLPPRVDAIASCGPLDHFARWHAQSTIEAPRVVAFGSTSLAVKQASADPAERALAARLGDAEARLFDTARARGVHATILRPTLVYGSGRDQTLTRIARFAQRWHGFVLPRGARGLRQPVHVDDLADAALAALVAPTSGAGAYDLPGGETLTYREMVARVLASLSPSPRLHELPAPVFALALSLARRGGIASSFGDAALARLREDLVFDVAPARDALGFAPRAFAPTAGMFSAD